MRWRRVATLVGATPLRIRLVVALVAVLACALTVVGAATIGALRRYLVGTVDTQLQGMADGARPLIAAGYLDWRVVAPPAEGGLQVPDRYVTETLNAGGAVTHSDPQPLPSNAPDLRHADLSRTDPFTVGSLAGRGHWRVMLIGASDGQHVLLAANLSDVDSVLNQLLLFLVVVGLGVLSLAVVVSLVLVRVSLRPLAEIERTTGEIAAGDLTRRVPVRDPGTEVGRLGHAFNAMIGRIERSFDAQAASEAAAHRSEARALRSEDKMRRFVADASHELRTPLTSIRGFAELYRQGAASDPREAEGLVRRIENEARRMGRLVEDLLLLARLDQQRPLAAEPVDLVVLAGDALDSARARAPHRPVTLELATGGGPLVVTGDEDRLRQVIANLVGNALTHTPEEASIALRLGRDESCAVIEVADTGPGLAPEQAQRVFERFYRADPARTHRAGASTGLGLAIVAAIVAAHGGEVRVDTAPGEGATFRVSLPLSPAG